MTLKSNFYELLTQNTTHDWQKRCNDLRQRGVLKREPLWVMTFPPSHSSLYILLKLQQILTDALVTGKISGMNGLPYGRKTFSIHAVIHHMNHAWDASRVWEMDLCVYICIRQKFFYFFPIWIPEQGYALTLNNTNDCSRMTNDNGTDGGKGQAGGQAGGG